MSLQPGLLIDRYGAEHGRFVAIQGIPFESRAMFPSASTKPYTIYRIVKPIDAIGGEIAPWFNKPGGGIQFSLSNSVKELVESGHLERIVVYK